MNAAVFINHNAVANFGYVDMLRFHPFDCFVDLINISLKLYNKGACLVGSDLSPDDIRCNIEVLG
jgi:hypothetical protein